MTSADEVAKILDLEPHPSGCTGWFRQTFADPTMVDSANGKRAASTSIYFLQRKGMRSAFHRQRSAEVRPILEFMLLSFKNCALHSVHIIFYAVRLTTLWQVFHHYMGAPLALYWINSKGELHKAILDKDLEKGQRPQVVMPAEVGFIQTDLLNVSILSDTGLVCPEDRNFKL